MKIICLKYEALSIWRSRTQGGRHGAAWESAADLATTGSGLRAELGPTALASVLAVGGERRDLDERDCTWPRRLPTPRP